MTIFRLTDRERLAVLAARVIVHLDQKYDEAQMENDPDLASLYNLADAMRDASEPYPTVGVSPQQQHTNRERRFEANAHADQLATETLRWDDDEPLARLHKRFVEELGRDL